MAENSLVAEVTFKTEGAKSFEKIMENVPKWPSLFVCHLLQHFSQNYFDRAEFFRKILGFPKMGQNYGKWLNLSLTTAFHQDWLIRFFLMFCLVFSTD